MRVILIDPKAKTVEYINLDGSVSNMVDVMECTQFQLINSPILDGNDIVYINSTGLLDTPEHYFTLPGDGQPLAGKALIVGQVGNYDTDAKTGLEWAKECVMWVTKEEAEDYLAKYAKVKPVLKRPNTDNPNFTREQLKRRETSRLFFETSSEHYKTAF